MANLPMPAELEDWSKEVGEELMQHALDYVRRQYGITAERLALLIQAEREGRLLILPRSEDYIAIRGDIVRDILLANARHWARENGEDSGNG